VAAGREQVHRLKPSHLLGRAVYAGGDDLLSFAPASAAVNAVEQLSDALHSALTGTVDGASASATIVDLSAPVSVGLR
jgi:CRISPR/Cas system-associated protein Cas10 (large subunit of type III CRISPR-Cas system)